MKGATLFSGGRGVEALLRDAVDFVLAVEYDPAIAAVGAQLGGHTIVGDVCGVDFSTWPALDYLHASPVCKNASQAKTDGQESDTDIQTAEAVCRALRAIRPRVFTLENVQRYAKFEAFRRICRTLDSLGYMWHWEVLNSADFGVPQTRRRLILRAVLGALLPTLPTPEPWIGWYAAIGGRLQESTPTPYQLRRVGTTTGTALIDTNNDSRPPTIRLVHEPAPTIPSSWWRRHASQGVWIANGKIGHITPHEGAILQSLPPWYQLPSDLRVAGDIVGNAVPSLLMSKIVRPLL